MYKYLIPFAIIVALLGLEFTIKHFMSDDATTPAEATASTTTTTLQ